MRYLKFAVLGGLSERTAMEFHGTARRISSVHFRGRDAEGIYAAGGGVGSAVRAAVWRGDSVRGVARGADGVGVDSHFCFVDQYSAGVWAVDDSGKQYRPDDRVGRRVSGGGRDVHDSGADFSGFWVGVHVLASVSAGVAWRVAGRFVHGAAAAAADL